MFLLPNKHIRDTIDNVMAMFEGKLMIGVHYRAFDHVFDWELVAPASLVDSFHDPNPRATSFEESGSIESFISIMRDIHSHFSYEFVDENEVKRVGNNCRFFIASNDMNKKLLLGHSFEDSVMLQGEHTRAFSDSVVLAVVEWFVLSESSLIVHHYGSSFAAEAAMRRQIPLVGVLHDHYIHHHDARLNHCGHGRFVRVGVLSSHKISRVILSAGDVESRGRCVLSRRSQ